VSRARFDPLVYRDPTPNPLLIRAMGPLNQHGVLPHLLRVRAIDFPREDLERLRACVRPGTAAFLGPNHPEFMTDWMLDKEISRRSSPLMAHWASYEIVNQSPAAQWLWLSNNLIANAPGGGGREYSIRWALAGHGVLLHPEGWATWQADHISGLVPGIIEMAWETCRRIRLMHGTTPAFVVPLVWKLHFERDVSAELCAEMNHIEHALGLPSRASLAVEKRFARLMIGVLQARRARFLGAEAERLAPVDARGFFEAQRAFADRLLADLEARHETTEGDLRKRLFAIRRSIRKHESEDVERARRDRAMLKEVERLQQFVAEIYDQSTLTQEHIAENLKQTRLALLHRGMREILHNLIPVAVAPRIAHVRVPEPMAIHEAFVESGDEEPTKMALLAQLHARLQAGVDGLIAECRPSVDRFRRENPFHTGLQSTSAYRSNTPICSSTRRPGWPASSS